MAVARRVPFGRCQSVQFGGIQYQELIDLGPV